MKTDEKNYRREKMTKNTIRKRDNKERYKDGWLVRSSKYSYMIESRVKKIFKKWLKENIHRFNYKPYPKNSMCEVYYFEGITKHVQLVIHYRLPEVMMYHHENSCNHDVIQYIGWEKYNKEKGYYDADRVDDKGEHYPEGSEHFDYYLTQEELYITEVFEHIITYVNDTFVEENQVYIMESECYASSRIAPKADYEKIKENFGGTSFCLSMSCGSDKHKTNEEVIHVYDLVEKNTCKRSSC